MNAPAAIDGLVVADEVVEDAGVTVEQLDAGALAGACQAVHILPDLVALDGGQAGALGYAAAQAAQARAADVGHVADDQVAADERAGAGFIDVEPAAHPVAAGEARAGIVADDVVDDQRIRVEAGQAAAAGVVAW